MGFEKGQSGNPSGRPKGAKDKRTELRELLQPHAPALVEKAVQLALMGDTTALKMCLDRIIPAMRSVEITSNQNEDYESLVERVERKRREAKQKDLQSTE